MKRTLIFTNLVSLCLLVIVYYSNCTPPAPTPPPPSGDCYANDYQNLSFNALRFAYVKSLINGYKTQQWTTINSSGITGVPQDARSVWFSLPVLKKFIHEIESQTMAHCGGCEKQLGIRIYYGAYPDSTIMAETGDMASIPSKYSKLHTVVMVPTYQNEDTSFLNTPSENVDFDPYHMTGCTPLPIDSLASGTMMALTPDLGMMNHGGLIPPPDNVTCTGARVMHFLDGLICP